MTEPPSQTKALRRVLIAAQERTAAQLAASTRNFLEFVEGAEFVNTDDEHDPEGSTIAFERAQVITFRNDAQSRLEALSRALERLDSGTYGRCTTCGGPIGDSRLAALPAVETCIDCAATSKL